MPKNKETKKKKKKKKQKQKHAAATTTAALDTNALEHFSGATYDLGVAVARGLFSAEECALLQRTGGMPGSVEINDRHEELSFRHRVWRIETSRAAWQHLFDRAIGAVRSVDDLYWRQIARVPQWHPEAEFIEYEVTPTKNGKPPKVLPGIGPHVDNASLVTLVVMLAPSEAYRGGLSCFEGKTPDAPRIFQLQQGDAVFFRGEKCEHWITDVEAGRRCILQIECCRMKPGRH
jgi:hypothetical protein